MGRLLSLLVALVAIAVLTLFCYIDKSQEIERDLVAKAAKRFDSKGIDWVTPTLKGNEFTKSRRLVLKGQAPTLEAKKEAVALVSNIEGVISVDDELIVITDQEVTKMSVEAAPQEEKVSNDANKLKGGVVAAAVAGAAAVAMSDDKEKIKADELALQQAKKAKEDALKAEEEARKQAEAEAKAKAEEEAQKQAELEAQRKAQEEAKAKADAERIAKAQEEALKRMAEVAAKRKAEEEAQKQAELEAQRKAQEEAKAKAEAKAKEDAKKLEKLPDIVAVDVPTKVEPTCQSQRVVIEDAKTTQMSSCQTKIDQLLKRDKIHFNYNKAGIKSGFAILDGVSKVLKQCDKAKVLVAGHTDSIGSDSYNKSLSLARANSVKKYLLSEGVEKNRIIVKGYGESRPIASNETEVGRAKNRRIEIKILGE